MITLWLILIVLILFPGIRYFALCALLGLVLVCFFIHHPLAIPFLVGSLLVMLWHIWKTTLREDEAWETNQKPRCHGYHPDNGWEYLENSDSDPLN